MKPDIYKLIERCVEDGVISGLHRAFKHNDQPKIEEVAEKIRQAIMNEICEWFEFGPLKDTGEE